MKKRIYIEDGDLVIRTSLKAERSNPYDDEWAEEMNNIVGVICGDEMGFAHWIDMSYKGKADQVSNLFYTTYMPRETFTALCNELGIELEIYPDCSCCSKPIVGSFTMGDKGDMCFNCELAGERKAEVADKL